MPRPRRGGTLVELLVALLLLDLAILTLATVSALAVRRIGEAGRLGRSAVAATNRVERLSARPCVAMNGGGADLEPGITETWSVRALPGAAEILDSIEVRSRVPDRVVLRARVPC